VLYVRALAKIADKATHSQVFEKKLQLSGCWQQNAFSKFFGEDAMQIPLGIV